ncbi:MAG TPA: lysophospholipid acyltransferase family protein [Polyangiaceae bacterium LLY-WYZ-15_(1-7)]|nr:lysophospholipid acyltransferase family protein [Polyangiaceae bacterium LLY-WYZ-15_(1-7)]HJL06764.1 lysophospholipid acyltransferase family protein [Polyangiaceae bacterium LLY-WYZ-15_(1-7)]HJL09186.1 lysophospholipid acyltransferase family protein [Polyangiaceae bacterium LLY-WYZ-15_(1-7)]HJL24560.1 lysophospholipid acyltransferase family protein [Polyangiaceae bacterium LLY-WYZ-15_(1-7)]HJL29601.1 lysophospholipid acyltransferase family protein [Polyangiaceae bacterium LLY-WYZ-15_(1-7)]
MLTAPIPTDPAVAERVARLDLPFNRYGIDPYGVDQAELGRFFTALQWLSTKYFHVDPYGLEHVPPSGPAMLVGNHSGGVAIDGAMILATCFFRLDPPRLAQGMADKFISKIPGASQVSARVGQFTGLPEHAERLLRDDRLLMVFPEGARGTAKLAHEADSLVRFGTGFVRLALKTGAPIVPTAFLGGGDALPTIANLRGLGKLLGMPYVPVPRYLLPVPRPTTFQLLFGAPMRLEGTGDEDDATIAGQVHRVRERIAWLIEQGRALRDGYLPADELELGA